MDSVIDAVPNLSVISQIELLCWKTDAAKEQRVKDFIADSTIFDITPLPRFCGLWFIHYRQQPKICSSWSFQPAKTTSIMPLSMKFIIPAHNCFFKIPCINLIRKATSYKLAAGDGERLYCTDYKSALAGGRYK